MKECDHHGVHVQVLSTIPVMFSYWAQPKDCLEVSKFLNDHIADIVNRYPTRFAGLGTVPLQDPDMAIRELERCMQNGMRGVQIGSHVNDWNLNAPELFQFFEAAEKMGAAIFVHPWDMMGQEKMQRYWLPWLVGMPAETSRAMCSMIFGGLFERLPKLRVNFAHAGGSFMSTIGRIEHGFNCRPDLVAIDNDINPRNYLGKFWVDSITHDPLVLEYVIKLQGTKKITLGSDYPFPLGDLEIGRFIEEMDISPESKEDIFSTSTLEWLDLPKSQFI
jgi:aminocarboxymuconate-semialdehyde decarboxylase